MTLEQKSRVNCACLNFWFQIFETGNHKSNFGWSSNSRKMFVKQLAVTSLIDCFLGIWHRYFIKFWSVKIKSTKWQYSTSNLVQRLDYIQFCLTINIYQLSFSKVWFPQNVCVSCSFIFNHSVISRFNFTVHIRGLKGEGLFVES